MDNFATQIFGLISAVLLSVTKLYFSFSAGCHLSCWFIAVSGKSWRTEKLVGEGRK